MKLKGCVSLLNILQGYSIIHTYGDEQVHQNANACEQGGGGGGMSMQTFTHNGGSYVSANTHTYIF